MTFSTLFHASDTTLTARETEILDFIARGLTSKQIARELNISPYTVNKAELQKAAVTYATTRVQQELQMQPLRAKVQLVNAGVESPIDYQRTAIKKMPLAADTLKMDAQYFSFDENEQKAQNTVSNIQRFISLAGSDVDSDASFEVAQSAVKQINRQRQMHKIAGTLVLTASLTAQGAGSEAFALLDYQTDRLHRRRGVASLLVRALLLEALQLGVSKVVGQVAADNVVSLHLLRRAGFRVEGWAAPARLRRGPVDCLELSRLLRPVDGAALARAHVHLPA